MLILRPYQNDLVAECSDAYRSAKRVILQLGCGGGKTIIASEIVRRALAKHRRTIFVAHRNEIIDQTVNKLRDAGLDPAELRAGGHVPDAPLLVASAQTLARRETPPFDLCVWDEIQDLYAQQKRLQEQRPGAWYLGLSATPSRLSGEPMGDLYDRIVSGPSPEFLIANGFLVPAVYMVAESPDLYGVPIRKGDYEAGGLEIAFNKPRLVGALVDTWLQHAQGRRTVCFTAGVAHSIATRDEYLRRGVRAAHVDGTTGKAERAAAFDALRAGDLDVLCNCAVAIAGLDIPEVSCVQWARASKSPTIFVQGTGRSMRPAPWIGKVDALVLDHAGMVDEHGAVEWERQWTLEGKPRVVGLPTLHTCKACLAIWDGPPTCPRCGAEPTSVPRKQAKVLDAPLVVVTAAELERRKRAASKEVQPRECPSWAKSNEGLWIGLERKRQREGYDLGDGGRFSGYTAAMWQRLSRRRA